MERLYRIRVAAEQVGVTEALLRAWERRYGLVKPQRTEAGYRAYTEADLALLRRVKRLTDEGLSIAEASRLAPQLRLELALSQGEGPTPVGETLEVSSVRIRGWVQALVRCASALDQRQVDEVIADALVSLSLVDVYERVLAPALVEIGELWQLGELSTGGEHLVTQAVRARLLGALSGPQGRGGRHVLCATIAGDEHDVGLMGAAVRFRSAGYRVTYLGPNNPAEAIARVAVRSRPDLVAIAAQFDQGEERFRRALEALLAELPRGTRVVVGGAGARAHRAVAAELGVELLDGRAQWQALLDNSGRAAEVASR